MLDGTFDWTDDAAAPPATPTTTAAHLRDFRLPSTVRRRLVDLLVLGTLGGWGW